MAEKLKEFANVTLTGADFTDSEYTIISNNDFTQAVIKDMIIEPTAPMANSNVAVMNGASTIASGGSSTGFELISQGSSLKIKLDPAMDGGISQQYNISLLLSNSTYKKGVVIVPSGNSYAVSPTSSYKPSATSDAATTSTESFNNPSWFHINAAGDRAYYFYYDSNSTTHLYYGDRNTSTGNVTNWNNWHSDSYRYAALDASEDKVYIHTTHWDVRTFDLATRTATSISAWNTGTGTAGFVPTTYAHSAAVNGIFFSQPSNSFTTSMFFYKFEENEAATLTGDFYAGGNGCLSVAFNPDEKRYYIITKTNTNTKLSYIDEVNLTGNCTATPAGTNVINIQDAAYYIGSTATGLFCWIDSDHNIRFGKAEKGGITTLDISIEGPVYNSCTPSIRAGATSVVPVSELDIELKVKVSGVEITGV